MSSRARPAIMRDDVLLHHSSGDWIRVRSVDNDATNRQHSIRGTIFTPASNLYEGFIGFFENDIEVVMRRELVVDSRGRTIPNRDGSMAISLQEFVPYTKKVLIVTNARHHITAQTIDLTSRSGSGHAQRLICRTKYTRYLRSDARTYQPGQTRLNPIHAEVWSTIGPSECTPGHGLSEYRLRLAQGVSRRFIGQGRPYTACDAFCGAGYASQGLKEAGVQVSVSFDNDEGVLNSYRINHGDTDARGMDLTHFIRTWNRSPYRVDILTISFPCQSFSPANTRGGRATNDEVNEAAWFGLPDLLRIIRPRAVVIEQTFGINSARFREHRFSAIAAFRNAGYSVSTRVLNFASLGMCSTRKRAIFLAAAPGERLPEYPKATHNTKLGRADTSLQRAVTIADVLRNVDRQHVNHDRSAAAIPQRSRNRGFDPQSAQLSTIMCSGSESETRLHYSGQRRWTVHELSLLNGGSRSYVVLGDSYAKQVRQVGNAFCTLAAKKIYEKVVESLRRTDAVDFDAEERARRGLPPRAAHEVLGTSVTVIEDETDEIIDLVDSDGESEIEIVELD